MNKLFEFREMLKLSKLDFAKEIGVSLSFYEKVEKGERQASKNFLEKLKIRYPQIDINIFFNTDYTNSVNESKKF